MRNPCRFSFLFCLSLLMQAVASVKSSPLCDYSTIDFSRLQDGVTPTESGKTVFPLEWSSFGLRVAGGYRQMKSHAVYKAVEGHGMTIAPEAGGEISLTLLSVHEDGMELNFWDVAQGGFIELFDIDGASIRRQRLASKPEEEQFVNVAAANVYSVLIHFEGEGSLSQMNVCKEPLSSKRLRGNGGVATLF
eukprot:Nitzschia sp. Nitz4//scaffold98_size77359//28719//29291//NITZ4_005546-RA/size77359-processed-gene-0.120-mRNA-1//1//CDS//3329560751//381//frame0